MSHCPMLTDDRCTIYEHRPRTCRTYDCRIFAAAGVTVDGDRVRIERQSRRWRFRHGSAASETRHAAATAAAAYLDEHRGELPEHAVPRNTTQLAVLAIELSPLFAAIDTVSDPAIEPVSGESHLVEPALDVVAAALRDARPEPRG